MIMLRRILFAVVALLVVLGAAWAFWPRPLAVEMTKIGRQSIDVTVEDEGISRIKDVYTVSAPIAGKLLRLNLQAGDAVKAAETILATMEPVAPGLLDARARAVAESNVSAIQAGVAQARAQVEQAQAQLDYAKAQLRRSQSLAGGGVIPEGVYQKSALDVSVAQTALEAAKASVTARQHELASAQAALIENEAGNGDAENAGEKDCVDIHAPITGVVLSTMATSEQVVAAGTPLLTLGDPGNLEIAVDLLSRDAVAVAPGDAATIEDWGGPTLKAVVNRVDPAAVTKVSALGIEEQRVMVVLRLSDANPARSRLGHDFRVVVRIVVWHGDNLIVVPMGALFRLGNDWAVYAVEDGKAQPRKISLGRQNADVAEVRSGLQPGDLVILHPGDRVREGTAVTPAAAE
jgi:HlyD family secretion protein